MPDWKRLRDDDLARVEALGHALDARWRVPGTSIRFGIDPVLGLVPIAGDLAGAAIGAYILLEARRLGAPPALLARMLGNLGVDTLLGSIPGLGIVFDVAFRAHRRNCGLLRDHLEQRDGQQSARRFAAAA